MDLQTDARDSILVKNIPMKELIADIQPLTERLRWKKVDNLASFYWRPNDYCAVWCAFWGTPKHEVIDGKQTTTTIYTLSGLNVGNPNGDTVLLSFDTTELTVAELKRQIISIALQLRFTTALPLALVAK